jgi:hypothetical protein
MDWGAFWEHVLSGVLLAVVAAGLAIFVTNRLTAKRAEESMRRERDLATARDLYRVAGELFAAWKLWDFHIRSPGPQEAPYNNDRRSEMIQLALSAEGQCESLIVRIVQEHDLTPERIEALWCLRTAFKELRIQIRNNEPLTWWATNTHGDDDEGYRRYTAYKRVLAIVGAMVENPTYKSNMLRDLFPRRGQTQPSNEQKNAKIKAIGTITSHETPPSVKPTVKGKEWVLVAEQLT